MRSADTLSDPKAIGSDAEGLVVGAIVGLAGDEYDDAISDAVLTDLLRPSLLETGVPVMFCGRLSYRLISSWKSMPRNAGPAMGRVGPVAVGAERSGRRQHAALLDGTDYYTQTIYEETPRDELVLVAVAIIPASLLTNTRVDGAERLTGTRARLRNSAGRTSWVTVRAVSGRCGYSDVRSVRVRIFPNTV